jgi:hypothetical protein
MAELITIATFQSVLDANVAQRKLEMEGVESYLADENMVSTLWIYSQAVGGVRLQVSDEDEQKAKEILNRPGEKLAVDHRIESDETIVCPNCQSNNIKKERYSKTAIALSWLVLGFPLPVPAVKYKCFYCDHQWNEKYRVSQKAKRRGAVIFLVSAVAVSIFVYFKYYYQPPPAPIPALPQNSYSWNPELLLKNGDLVSLLNNFEVGSPLGYQFYRGGNLLPTKTQWDPELIQMMTKQEESNVLREIFAGYHVKTADYWQVDQPVLVHIAIAKNIPALPLNVSGEDSNLSREYIKGPLRDSDYYGFYKVGLTTKKVGFLYTLFYVHKRNLLFEVAVPGDLDFTPSERYAQFDDVIDVIERIVVESKLGLIDFSQSAEPAVPEVNLQQ